MWKTFFKGFPAVLCLTFLAGCPSGGGPGGDGSGDGGSPVSNSERMASLDQIQQMIEPFELNGDPAASDQIVALLSAMPEIASAEVHEGSVIARFTDNELLVVANNRPVSAEPAATTLRSIQRPVPMAGGVGDKTSRRASLVRVPGSNSSRLPESKNVLLINAMGTAFKDDTPEFREWFAAAGYDPTVTDGTIESFRDDVKDLGVLYVSSHGALVPARYINDIDEEVLQGVGETPPPGFLYLEQLKRDHFCIWTRTVVNDQTVEKYRNEVQRGRLLYFFARNNFESGKGATMGRHFGFTELFIHDNWTFKDGALIYMDCCQSANGRIKDVCLLSKVNGAVYAGWTQSSYIEYTSPSARFFFDRTLGANSYSKANPKDRPFSVKQVMVAMHERNRRGLDPDPSLAEINPDLLLDESITTPGVTQSTGITIADLAFFFRAEDCILVPGILNVKAGSDVMTVQGTFGGEPGTVTAGGVNCPVRTWTTNRIECDVPRSGPGSSGNVVVESGERRSNPRALTQWDLTLRRVFMDYPTQGGADCPSCFYEATLHFTIRADAAPARLNLDEPVAPSNYIGGADSGSIDVTNAGGSYFIGQGSTITLAPNPDDGAAFIGTCTGFLPTADNNYLGACFFLQGSNNLIAFSPTISAEGLLQNYTGGVYDGIVDPHQVIYSGNPIGNELNLLLSPNFNIAAGNKMTGPNSYFEWDAADAVSPPDPDAPR